MKHTLFAAAFCLLFTSLLFAQNDEIHIIPKPQSIIKGSGSFTFNKNTKIVAAQPSSEKVAALLNEYVRKTYGFKLRVSSTPGKNSIALVSTLPAGKDNGAYTLWIIRGSIVISGSEAGLFNGFQSLIQLMPQAIDKEASIPEVRITDEPRFPYRGMHLDVGRNFEPVEFVKKYIDLMAQYKLNYFHWHLTEDQGWRIEIKKYPKLTEVGSHRPETVKEKNLNPYIGDGTPEGGFYTQEQIKDVVAYAKARYITVIPEIELPGHSSAALAAYPELGCKQDYTYKVQMTWGIFKEVYCPTEKTFSFLEDVLTEVIGLFPDSPYIHIGGDEVLKSMWSESPEVKELMARENLKDVNEVQSYFVRRMEKFINSKGKKIIGWDEILEGGLAPNATVMSWRGIKGGIEAAKAHHDVIMTPTDYVYLDYGQGDPAYEPINIGSYVPLEKVYSFDPVPKELNADEAKYIIGGQANLWTEYLPTAEKVEYMVFPRMLALAEDVWTMPGNKNYADFLHRLSFQLTHLDKENVNYRIPEPEGLHNMILGRDDKSVIELTPSVDGAKIYYTTDGSTPDERSTLYAKPFEVDVAQGKSVEVKTVTALASGRKSFVNAATIMRRDLLPGVNLPEKRIGLTYALSAPDAMVIMSGETRSLGPQQFAKTVDLTKPFALGFDGYINIAADGLYEFQIDSLGDVAVIINGDLVNLTGEKNSSMKTGIVPLKAGYHKIAFRYSKGGGDARFRVRLGIKGQGLSGINADDLAH